jgi:hypothetical protein
MLIKILDICAMALAVMIVSTLFSLAVGVFLSHFNGPDKGGM